MPTDAGIHPGSLSPRPCGPSAPSQCLWGAEGLTEMESTGVALVGESRRVAVPMAPQAAGSGIRVGPRCPTPVRSSQAPALSSGPHLPDELAPLVHADVLLALSPLDAHPAPEGVRLHDELGCDGGGRGRPLSMRVAGPGGCRAPPISLTSKLRWGTWEAPTPDLGMNQVRLARAMGGLR